MSPRQRIVSAIILSVLTLVGVGLILISRQDPIEIPYDTQKTVCNFEYALEIDPSQSVRNNCVVLQNDWLHLDLESALNLSYSISLAKVSGGQIVLFNDTGSELNASFPITSNGAILTILGNYQDNVSSVNGSLTIFQSAQANTTSLTVTHPYRSDGEALVGLGVLGLLLVIWNPSLPGISGTLPTRRFSNP